MAGTHIGRSQVRATESLIWSNDGWIQRQQPIYELQCTSTGRTRAASSRATATGGWLGSGLFLFAFFLFVSLLLCFFSFFSNCREARKVSFGLVRFSGKM
mmetsp:Transcript_15176/g.26010  ORF Transcript_15176/g.26010 Transcript_15176/m.26010 type:complete len:100 (+) Transcript_15176:664-963(+)